MLKQQTRPGLVHRWTETRTGIMRQKAKNSCSARGIVKILAAPALLLFLYLHAAQGQDPGPLAFGSVDSNANNQISGDELKAMIPDASDAYKTRFVDVCMLLYDDSKDGSISQGEVSNLVSNLLAELAKNEANMYNAIIFEMDDADGDDQLDVAETEASFSFDSSGCEAPIEVFDENADGKLNYQEAQKMASAVSALSVRWAEGPMKCHTVSDLNVIGTFCDGNARLARVCAPQQDDGEVYAKMKAHCMIRKFEATNELTTCTDMASDFCANVGGSVSPDAQCNLLCQQAMSECLIDSDCPGGTQRTLMSLSVTGQDVITESYPALPFKVYAGYPWPFYGCAESSFFACGTQVASGTLTGNAGSTSVSFQVGSGGAAWFLVVIGGAGGYGSSYYEIHMMADGSNSVHGSMLQALSLDMDRLVLSWPHAGDLDMWVFATDANDNIKGSVGWNYGKTTGTFGSTTVSLDKDHMSGLNGPEVMRFQNMAGFTFQVWVHFYNSDRVFMGTEVMDSPATLDVYCYKCHDNNGKTVSGLAASVTQDYAVIPSGGRDWWNAGYFVAPSSAGSNMRVQWKTCTGQACYSHSPAGFIGNINSQGTLSLSAKNSVTGSMLSATWEVYTAFPTDFVRCKNTNSCGALANDSLGNEASGSLLSYGNRRVQVQVGFGMSSYLVVVSHTGYYTVYVQVDLRGGSTEIVSAQMVQLLLQDQDRVVMRWGYGDIDLWVVGRSSGGGYVGSVGWNTPGRSATLGGTSITLDVDNWDGTSGPETTQLNGMSTGIYEVWIHSYPGRPEFTREFVSTDPATVDVYCYSCHDASGNTRAGLVTSVTQLASDVPPSQAYRWMKVGQFTAPSPQGGSVLVKSQWTSCVPSVESCYQTSDPTSEARRRSLGMEMGSALKPDVEKRGVKLLPNGQPTTATPPSVKFAKNPDWAAFKEFNDRVQQALSRVTAKKGSKHVAASKQMQHAAGLRAIGGARHSGRSSTMKAALSGNQQLRNHGMVEYGFTIGDFSEPFHVSAIGDIHLICCDRFERAVRDTCSDVSDTMLTNWINVGKTDWCHDTSCFDGQGLREWTNSLSWLDYTQYRWGNVSFTTRSECQEPRDWPVLMEHFKSMEGCTGGLGKLMESGRFHVWACFHNHPCATRALTDPVGLWILFEQGYREYSIDQVNILLTYVSGQILLVNNWDGTMDGAAGLTWGIFSWTQVQMFFVFMIQMVIELGDVFGDVRDASIFGDLWWIGLSGQSGTCEDIGRNGVACRDTTCCFYHPMLGCQSQAASHPCHGSAAWTLSMSVQGWSGATGTSVGATYRIYSLTSANQNTYWGCGIPGNCGPLIKSGVLSSSGTTSVTVDSSYDRVFVVFESIGYIDMYYSINMYLATEIISGQMIGNLLMNQDKILLRWSSDQDLDLWIFVRDPPMSNTQGALRGSVGYHYGKTSFTTGATNIEYLVDSQSGHDGPEITGMENAAGGVYEVWVNIWSENGGVSFNQTSVQIAPASVDVYCGRCHDVNGAVKSGGVQSYTQAWSSVSDAAGMAWWKVGEYIAPSPLQASMRMQWVACTSNCYQTEVFAPTGTGTLKMQAFNTVNRQRLTGEYRVYKEFPVAYEGCLATTTCGEEVKSGDFSGVADTLIDLTVNYGVSNYLIIMTSTGYYPSYDSVALVDGATRVVSAQMVGTLAEGTDRVVLRWQSFKDLDLWVVFKTSSGTFVGSVGHSTTGRSQTYSVGGASLDVDNWNGALGPETSLLRNIGTGIAEIWVDRYTTLVRNEKFLPEDTGERDQKGVRGDPAVVDIYSSRCHNVAGVVVEGGVATVTQIASTIPAAGARYWKAGQFVGPSPAGNNVRLQWLTCVANTGIAEIGGFGSGCWTNANPHGGSARRSLSQPKPEPDTNRTVYADAHARKVQAERAKVAKKARKERIDQSDMRKQEHAESHHAKSHARARYYYGKNLEGGGIKATRTTPSDAAKSEEHAQNAGREWTQEDGQTVGAFIKNLRFFKRAVADKFGLDKIEETIVSADNTTKTENYKIRSSHSPAGPREAMCYVYDEMYKNWVPWGPNSILQIHDWSAIWSRPHWPQYDTTYVSDGNEHQHTIPPSSP